MKKQTAVWTTQDGTKVRICEMPCPARSRGPWSAPAGVPGAPRLPGPFHNHKEQP